MTSISQTRPLAAALHMVTAMAIVGYIDIYVTVIAAQVSVWQFLLVRMTMTVPLVVLLSLLGFGGLRPRNWRAVMVRSGFIATAMFFYFGSLAFMPIAMALAGLFTSPIFVLLITAFVLRQRIGPFRIVAVTMGFVGILIVLGPSGGALGWALALPVMGGMLYAAGVVATRAMCEGETTLTLLIGIFLAQGAIASVALIGLGVMQPEVGSGGLAFLTRGWVWPLEGVWGIMAMQVIGSVIGVGLLNRAYQLGEASHVAIFEYSVMIFGPVFAWCILGQAVTPVQGIGITLIALADIIIALRGREV